MKLTKEGKKEFWITIAGIVFTVIVIWFFNQLGKEIQHSKWQAEQCENSPFGCENY